MAGVRHSAIVHHRRRYTSGGVARGLLREWPATNLLPDTVNLTTGWGWNGGIGTLTPGQALRSSTYGVRVQMASSGGSLRAASATALAGAANCASVYWKKGTGTNGRLLVRDNADVTTLIDCSWTESAPNTLALTTAAGTCGYIALGNGEYRIWGMSTAFVAANGYGFYLVDTSALGTYNIWGLPQFEQGRFPSSPIPNTAAGSISRAADTISYIGSAGLLGNGQGAVAVRATQLAQNDILSADQHIVKVDAVGTNQAHIRSAGSAGLRGYVNAQGLAQGSGLTFAQAYNRKTASAVRGNGAGTSLHTGGATVATTAVAPIDMSAADRIMLGTDTGNDPLNAILWELATYAVDPGAAALNAADAGTLPAGSSYYALLTGAFPAGWTITRSGIALDDQLLSIAANTPRYAAGAF